MRLFHATARAGLLITAFALQGCGGDCLNPAGCNKGDGPTTSAGAAPVLPSGTYAITYSASGTLGTVEVVYTDPNGGGSSSEIVTLPWRKQFYAEKGADLSLRASSGNLPGNVTINIFANGVLLGSGVGTGPFAYTNTVRKCC